MFRTVRPGDAWLAGRRPFLTLMAEAAEHLGGRLELEERFGHVGRYHAPGGAVRPIFGNALGLNAEAAAMLAADKSYTAETLAAAGLPVPRGAVLFSPAYAARMQLKNEAVAAALPGPDAALSAADGLGWPLIVKPNSGSEGRGVSRVETPGHLAADLAALFSTDDRVRMEEWVPGLDTRVTVLDGAVRLAYRRLPPMVVGDGVQNVRALAEVALAALAARHRGPKLSVDDPRVARALAAQGAALDTVPAAGAELRLLDTANLSAGGRLDDLTGRLSPEAEALATRTAETVGLRLAGVDLRAADLAEGTADAVVIEVNAAPGLDYYASHGAAQWQAALDLVTDALSR
ncbi:ATP-dependent carboxylate-amine ligase [Rhodovulum sp. 12E13]|uniref:ATP-dependent carboxylate-amine ligase n=1 Tax=Rhodovulum sp. 12E13 TaxID=2203891 RepID=UPI000E158329|nr:ATP-dependent carboxylate-amine ligase [Rhodovulum sp. 12E13]RDC74835.1 ATP-dependent carboxylate-amine ligase [Rhodovulum sp. 12E13]